ncbi:four helix bundle protein [Robertmurraya sp. DFI.2.37]|uniref:four helix bundle protein n=1 Tax=Robertmurraya sp. DFI.2.37 TaxID=3031819 RepID=UPI0012493F55|nr:four helix bundle protein [Robertmurraya sp. DFI.2.37]MDF1510663.1 four helix bundle protein [Robertmurraya sp. DFI.2.37]
MKTIKKYVGNVRDLKVYRKALLFRKVVYAIVKVFPEFEQENLSDMLRKSSCSIVSNLAEGNTNFYYKKEYSHLNMALSKLAECRSTLDIARMEGYISESLYTDVDLKAEEILKMIIGMMNRIEHYLQYDDHNMKEIVEKFDKPLITISELIEKTTTFNDFILTIIEQYPPSEKNNQVDQITRASKSILQNLGNLENTSYSQQLLSLNTSLGSISECKAFIDMAIMENFITEEQYHRLDEIGGEILDLIIGIMNQVELKNNKVNKEVS